MKTQIVTGITLLGACGLASAGPLNFVEVGDAGQAGIGAAQSVLGIGPLTSISGAIGAINDADLYKFTITTPGAFSASAQFGGGSSSLDTILFLFNSAGMGVAYSDDSVAVATGGTLPVGNALYSGLSAGTYYIGISGWDVHATNGGGFIFPQYPGASNFAVHGATGPGGGAPLTGFNTAGASGVGTYTIAFTGAGPDSPIPLPTGAAMAMVGMGLIGVRRRRS